MHDKLIRSLKFQHNSVNMYWYSIETFNIFLMQMGFTFLEAGSIRIEHQDHILLKNIMDLCAGSITWWLVGFGLAYGHSYNGLFGTNYFLDFFDGEAMHIKWVNSWTFQSTACTIVSGAIAERMQISAYIVLTTMMSLFIFPIAVHWVWNDHGWLWTMGYQDFAGCGPVHILGGFTGLIVTYLLGPRLGQFQALNKAETKEQQKKFKPNNIAYVVMGTLILWYTWYSFNASSQNGIMDDSDRKLVGLITTNTTMAAIFGGMTVYLFQHIKQKLFYTKLESTKDESQVINTQGACMGILSGLVGITAGCNVVSVIGSSIIGVVSSIVYISTSELLLHYKIDDPLNASPIHMGVGIWGALSVGLFHTKDGLFYGEGMHQFWIQCLGCATLIGFTFITVWPISYIFKRYDMLRISKEEEQQGFSYQVVLLSNINRKNNRSKKKKKINKNQLKSIKEIEEAPGNYDNLMNSKKSDSNMFNYQSNKNLTNMKASHLSDTNSNRKKDLQLNHSFRSWDNSESVKAKKLSHIQFNRNILNNDNIQNNNQQQQLDQQQQSQSQKKMLIPQNQKQSTQYIFQQQKPVQQRQQQNNSIDLQQQGNGDYFQQTSNKIGELQSLSQRMLELNQQENDYSYATVNDVIPEEQGNNSIHNYENTKRLYKSKICKTKQQYNQSDITSSRDLIIKNKKNHKNKIIHHERQVSGSINGSAATKDNMGGSSSIKNSNTNIINSSDTQQQTKDNNINMFEGFTYKQNIIRNEDENDENNIIHNNESIFKYHYKYAYNGLNQQNQQSNKSD